MSKNIPEQTPKAPPKKSKKKLIIGGIIAIIAIIGAIYFFQGIGDKGSGNLSRILAPPIDQTLAPIDTTTADKTKSLEITCSANPESIKIGELAEWKVEAKNVPEGSQVNYTWSGSYKDANITTAIADYTYIYNKEGTYRAKIDATAGKENASAICVLNVSPIEQQPTEEITIECEANPNTIEIGGYAAWTLDKSNVPTQIDTTYTWSGNYNDKKNTTAINDYGFIYKHPGTYTANITATAPDLTNLTAVISKEIATTTCSLTVTEKTIDQPINTTEPTDTIGQLSNTIKPTDTIDQPIDTIETTDTIDQPINTIETTDTISQPIDISETLDTIYQPIDIGETFETIDQPIDTIEASNTIAQYIDTVETPATRVARKSTDTNNCAGFKDIIKTDNDCDAITYVSAKNIMTGSGSESSFNPEDQLNRAEMAKIAVLLTNSTVETCTEQPFPDVSLDAWYAPYVCFAKENGIITGYTSGPSTGLYGPANLTNRSELLAIVLRTLEIEPLLDDLAANYLDVSKTDWFYEYAAKSFEYGLFEGNYLYPAKVATRRETARVIYKLSLIENN